MIRTWVASIKPLYEEGFYRVCYRQVPSFRREKADRMRGKQVRAQSIGVWILYEHMKREYGLEEGTAYNLSHSGDYVLCSVSTGQKEKIGCDIEEMKEPDLKIARRFFCPDEYERIAEEKDQVLRQELFYRYWVLKESFIKATREGLALGMDTFEIVLGRPPILVRQPEAYSESYYYREGALRDGRLILPDTENDGLERMECGKKKASGMYRIAVCSTDPDIEDMIQVDLIDLQR